MYRRICNATSLHTGGGLTYLYLLNKYLDRKENILILDYRVKNKFSLYKKAKIFFVKNNLFGITKLILIRFFYIYKNFLYQNTKEMIEINLNGRPPLFRIFHSKTYIFLQNKFLTDSLEYKYKISIKNLKVIVHIFVNKFLFKLLLKKKDIIIVQTNTMYKSLSSSYKNKIVLQEKIWGEYDLNLLK